jgi:hypothetical protein
MDLYYYHISAPCRSVLMVGEYLNLKWNLKTVDLLKNDQLKEDFIKVMFRTSDKLSISYSWETSN